MRRSGLPMNLPPLVAADVRRVTVSQRVLREKDQSLVTSAPTLDWLGFMAPMCVRNAEVRATHEPPPSGSSRRQEGHCVPTRPPGKRSEPRYLGSYVRLAWVHGPNVRPQCGGPGYP